MKLITTLLTIAALLVATHAYAQACPNCQQTMPTLEQPVQPPDGSVYVRGPLGAVWVVSGSPLAPQISLPYQPVRRTWLWLWGPASNQR